MGKSRNQKRARDKRLSGLGSSHVIGLSEKGKKLRAQIAERRKKGKP